MYWLARNLLYGCIRLLFRLRIEGREHLPPSGPVILYANHGSWLDIPLLGAASNRIIRFMAKAELFRVPVLGALIRFLGAFPVHRGEADRQAVKQALAILKEGGVLGIFPEGTRSKTGQIGRAEPGTAYLLWKSGAIAVPVGISSRYGLFGPIVVRVGPPLDVTDLLPARPTADDLQKAADRMMAAAADLLVPSALRQPGERSGDPASPRRS